MWSKQLTRPYGRRRRRRERPQERVLGRLRRGCCHRRGGRCASLWGHARDGKGTCLSGAAGLSDGRGRQATMGWFGYSKSAYPVEASGWSHVLAAQRVLGPDGARVVWETRHGLGARQTGVSADCRRVQAAESREDEPDQRVPSRGMLLEPFRHLWIGRVPRPIAARHPDSMLPMPRSRSTCDRTCCSTTPSPYDPGRPCSSPSA